MKAKRRKVAAEETRKFILTFEIRETTAIPTVLLKSSIAVLMECPADDADEHAVAAIGELFRRAGQEAAPLIRDALRFGR